MEPGFVVTVEPGCYFIPALIDQWKRKINIPSLLIIKKLEEYRDFGGIRIEDDVLVTETGHRILVNQSPKQWKKLKLNAKK